MWPINQIKSYRQYRRVKENPVFQALVVTLGESPVWTKRDIARLTKAGYQNCCTVHACVNERAGGVAGVPWQLFQRPMSKTGKREIIEDHGLLNLIRRPNPGQGGSAFIMRTMGFYLISGNSYLTRVGPDEGPPLEMYSIRPDRMKVLPGNKFDPIKGYRYTVNGVDRKPDFTPEEILHLKAFHPLDDFYGLSPIEVAGKEVDISSMSRDWNMKLLQNDCRPPGGIIVEGTLDDEQREDLLKMYSEKLAGYKNVGMPPVLEGGVKWEPWAITPKDMDWLNSDKMNARKICSVYNVAPEIIGDAENKTYSNYKEARKALYVEAILPDLDFLRDEFNNWLTPAFGDRLYLEYDKNAIEAIQEEQNAVYERQTKAYWRTVNEKRIACGDDEIGKAGDVILVPANLIPLMDISGNIEEE